jgi:dTDP-4-amino-4,6-dideoxygalactose transaminase
MSEETKDISSTAKVPAKKAGSKKVALPPTGKELTPLPEFMSFSPPSLDGDELKELEDTLKSGWITHGPKTARFEKEMASYLKSESALAVSSCTAALHLALRSLGIGPEDGVITSPLTFVSTAHAIVYTGATPFFCDVSSKTGNLDPDKVKDFIQKECKQKKGGAIHHHKTDKRIRAILPIHYGGFPVDINSFCTLANKHKLHMVEDAAHALGAFYQGYPIGGDTLRSLMDKGQELLTAFSFYATKNLTTGEGGMLTGPPKLIEKARILSAYGISDARRIWGRYAPKGTWHYDVETLGFKNNFTDIQAGLGLAQLKRFDKLQEIRANYAKIYTKTLDPLGSLVKLPMAEKNTTPAWHLYPLRLNLAKLKITRNEFIEKLKTYNIGTSVMFIPIHGFTYYKKLLKYKKGSFPNAEKFFESVVSLPMSPKHPEERIIQAAELIRDLIALSAK